MLPFLYEWHWDLGHFIFMGLFYLVLVIIGFTLSLALFRSIISRRRAKEVERHEVFHDMAESRLKCRYQITGILPDQTCHHEFDCATCPVHEPRRGEPVAASAVDQSPVDTLGCDLDDALLYHRGQTYVQKEADGNVTVGLSDLANRILGYPDEVILPPVGTKLILCGNAFWIKKGKTDLRILSPIAGEIVETGNADKGWWLKIKPAVASPNFEHLYDGDLAKAWIKSELEMVSDYLGTKGESPLLAGGGKRVDSLPSAYPKAPWKNIWNDLFLDV
jgi:glycine cleavage system H lipoate-binding protein